MKVHSVYSNCGKNYFAKRTKKTNLTPASVSDNVNFKGNTGRILGGVGGFLAGVALTAIAPVTAPAIIAMTYIGGKSGDTAEENLKRNIKDNENKKDK